MGETYKVRQSGLMRCCLLTLDDEMTDRLARQQPLMIEGETLRCRWCKDDYGMVCKTSEDGVIHWQWAKPPLET